MYSKTSILLFFFPTLIVITVLIEKLRTDIPSPDSATISSADWQAPDESTILTETTFWTLLEGLPIGQESATLKFRLEQLTPNQIQAFYSYFVKHHNRAYRWDIWAAAYLVEGGCSDDSFSDFRNGLLARGKERFEAAL